MVIFFKNISKKSENSKYDDDKTGYPFSIIFLNFFTISLTMGLVSVRSESNLTVRTLVLKVRAGLRSRIFDSKQSASDLEVK